MAGSLGVGIQIGFEFVVCVIDQLIVTNVFVRFFKIYKSLFSVCCVYFENTLIF
jgi:hypothetical protein